MSQLVMRSFDVADKGELNKGERALWGGEVRGHPAITTTAKERKRGGSVGGDRKQFDSTQTKESVSFSGDFQFRFIS